MKRETLILSIMLFLGVVALAVWVWRVESTSGRFPGSKYVEEREVISLYDPSDAVWIDPQEDAQGNGFWAQPTPDPETGEPVPADLDGVEPAKQWRLERGVSWQRAGDEGVTVDLWRTIGLWFAALCTLFVFSFLYRDNPFYKFAEALVVGVSAAYTMVVGWWTMVVPNLIGKLWPSFVANHILPEHDQPFWPSYLIVAILGLMLLWRLSPVGGWIARWPLAFVIGITAGLRLIAHLQADFAIQIQATILPLLVNEDGRFNLWLSIRNSAIILGVLTCLTYFFFSIEHKGFVGRTARVGIWVLMITFGAGFAYTVMGRITLLTQRIQFLFGDWLWLIQ